MAKKNNANWHDWAIILLIVLAVLTNVYWLMTVRDLNDRVDTHTNVLLELSEQ